MRQRHRIVTLIVSSLLVFAGHVGLAANVDFDNDSTDGNWNTASNWTNNAVPTAADNVFLGDTVAGPFSVAITASPLNQINELGVGRSIPGTYTVNHSAGDLVTNSWTNLGQDTGRIGIYNLSGGSVTKNGGGNNVLGGFNSAQGELHISNNALWRVNSGFTALGGETTAASTTIGIITVDDTARFENPAGTVYVGRGGTGTFIHNSSNTSTMGGLDIANFAQGMGTVEVNNGVVAVGAGQDINIGRENTTNTPILDINNTGSVTHGRNTVIGRDGQGIIDVSGSGSLQTNWLIVGEGAANVNSELALSDNATLSTTRLTLGNGGANNGLIELTGSNVTATTNLLDVLNNGSNTFSWVADGGGISSINVNGDVQLGDANLLVDLSGIGFANGTLDLIDYSGNLSGVFDTISIMIDGIPLTEGVAGNLTDFQYSLSYGSGANDAVSLSFQIPEPSTLSVWVIAGVIGLALSVRRRRRKSR